MSACDSSLSSPIEPSFPTHNTTHESAGCQKIISTLNMLPHPEGGYFAETDRDPYDIPNPFLSRGKVYEDDENHEILSASSSIFYYLTPSRSQGNFHRNLARTVHTLHKGRGRYVIIHSDDAVNGGKARIETFVVGHDIEKGEKLQWVVEGGKYKASFLLPDKGTDSSQGLLISETVVPGFTYYEHDYLRKDRLEELVEKDQAEELKWLIRFDKR